MRHPDTQAAEQMQEAKRGPEGVAGAPNSNPKPCYEEKSTQGGGAQTAARWSARVQNPITKETLAARSLRSRLQAHPSIRKCCTDRGTQPAAERVACVGQRPRSNGDPEAVGREYGYHGNPSYGPDHPVPALKECERIDLKRAV